MGKNRARPVDETMDSPHKVGDRIAYTAAMQQRLGVWPQYTGEGTVVSIEPWNGAWLLQIDWDNRGILPLRLESLVPTPPCRASEEEPGFSAEYGNWYGACAKKEKVVKRDRAFQAFREENLRALLGLD